MYNRLTLLYTQNNIANQVYFNKNEHISSLIFPKCAKFVCIFKDLNNLLVSQNM